MHFLEPLNKYGDDFIFFLEVNGTYGPYICISYGSPQCTSILSLQGILLSQLQQLLHTAAGLFQARYIYEKVCQVLGSNTWRHFCNVPNRIYYIKNKEIHFN